MSINTASISGNLTRDGVLKSTAAGTATVSFGVAVSERRKDSFGEWNDYTNYIDCVLFGKRADALYNRGYFAKGRKVFAQGHLHYSSWEHDGTRRTKLELVVDEIDFAPAQAVGTTTESTPSYNESVPF